MGRGGGEEGRGGEGQKGRERERRGSEIPCLFFISEASD